MARVLVTGDAGFIGFHLSKRLLREGHQVCGLDALTEYYDPQLKVTRRGQLHPDRQGDARVIHGNLCHHLARAAAQV